LAHVTSAYAVTAFACGLQKKEVPNTIKNTAYLLALTLTEDEINLVNALLNSVQSFGVDINSVPHGTATVRLEFF
jgi:hypothetical protein